MRKHVRPGSPPGGSSLYTSLYIQDINLLHLPSLRDSRDHLYTLRGHSPPFGIAIRDNAKKREGLLEVRALQKALQILLLETSLQCILAFGLA